MKTPRTELLERNNTAKKKPFMTSSEEGALEMKKKC